MKYLITGANGFIGRNLIARLKDADCEIMALQRSTSDVSFLQANNIEFFRDDGRKDLNELFEKCCFDGVVHLASLFLKDHRPDQIPDLVQSNITFPTRVLEAAAATGVRWFVNTGTFWQHYNNAGNRPANLYAATKTAFESIAGFYMDCMKIDFVTLRLNDTFGPGDTRPKIFNLLLDAMKNKTRLSMTAGEQVMDISYIDNIIDAYVQLINVLNEAHKGDYSGAVFGVFSGERLTLRELVGKVENIAGKKVPVEWNANPYREREIMEPWSAGHPVPGWVPRISLEEGLRLFLIASRVIPPR